MIKKENYFKMNMERWIIFDDFDEKKNRKKKYL